jgi:hypothetical protein
MATAVHPIERDEVIEINPNNVSFTSFKIKPAPFGTNIWFKNLFKKFFPKSNMIDMDDLNILYLTLVIIAFYFSWIALGVYFGYETYNQARTAKFISLNQKNSIFGNSYNIDIGLSLLKICEVKSQNNCQLDYELIGTT